MAKYKIIIFILLALYLRRFGGTHSMFSGDSIDVIIVAGKLQNDAVKEARALINR